MVADSEKTEWQKNKKKTSKSTSLLLLQNNRKSFFVPEKWLCRGWKWIYVQSWFGYLLFEFFWDIGSMNSILLALVTCVQQIYNILLIYSSKRRDCREKMQYLCRRRCIALHGAMSDINTINMQTSFNQGWYGNLLVLAERPKFTVKGSDVFYMESRLRSSLFPPSSPEFRKQEIFQSKKQPTKTLLDSELKTNQSELYHPRCHSISKQW